MLDNFAAYLRSEQNRLDRALAEAMANAADEGAMASLRQQRRVVDEQLARWMRDLSEESIAA